MFFFVVHELDLLLFVVCCLFVVGGGGVVVVDVVDVVVDVAIISKIKYPVRIRNRFILY